LWHEEHLEVEKREEAHELILKSKNPVIAWDLSAGEWELITGFDCKNESYEGISVSGEAITLPIDKLGRREIPILFVMELMSWQEPEDTLDKVLKVIVNHHQGNEMIAGPDYLEGYKAYDHWINKMKEIREDDWESRYYFETYALMKGYASKYFKDLLKKNEKLDALSKNLDDLAHLFNELLKKRNDPCYPNNKEEMIMDLRKAKELEFAIYTEAKSLL